MAGSGCQVSCCRETGLREMESGVKTSEWRWRKLQMIVAFPPKGVVERLEALRRFEFSS